MQFPSEFFPRTPFAALIHEIAFFLTQTTLHRVEQFAGFENVAGSVLASREGFQHFRGVDRKSAQVTAVGVLATDVIEQFVGGHADEQSEQLLRGFQIEASGCGLHKELSEYRLTDVHRVETATQTRICQIHSDSTADGRFVESNQFRRGGFVADASALHQIRKGMGVRGHFGSPGIGIVMNKHRNLLALRQSTTNCATYLFRDTR